MRIVFVIFLSLSVNFSFGQGPSTGKDIETAILVRSALREGSILKNYPVRNVGPVIQGGRITDFAVNSESIKKFYVAYASGGIFKTENNGITFKPVFDNQGALGIGDIAIAPSNAQILWAGTGENNSSRSSYAGSGVYISTDEGYSWKFMGLEGTQHTGRIIIHPDNPDIVWVASLGNLYTHNPERGVYKTMDGGKTWDKTLFVNDSTGIVDLLIHPENPDILWAASWERTRKAWNFKGHGPGSGIYKSVDGGINWDKVNTGFEDEGHWGRIGIDISPTNPDILYALIDNQYETKEDATKDRKGDELLAADFVNMSKEDLLALDEERLNTFLKSNHFPEKYKAEVVKKDIRKGVYKPKAIADYLGGGNEALFNTNVKGAQVYRTEDGGENWAKVHDFSLDGVYYTYGYYFGEVRVSPDNPDVIFVFGVPLLKSLDGGKTYSRADTIGDVHADHQAMWINPSDADHILLGNDGGFYMTYDGGVAWDHINNTCVGQFYTISVDMAEPYNIYGGLQDNGVLMGSSKSIPNETEHWKMIMGGDGMFVVTDPENENLVYTGYQFGNYYRINRETGKQKYVSPRPDIGEEKLRFNWRTPVVMSPHNSDILYMGAQKLFRTMDQGESWSVISPDLTGNRAQGNVPFSTITAIAESPHTFGVLYTGTDDGQLHISKDGGGVWNRIDKDLPDSKWISNIWPSKHTPGKVYVSLTGYREDDFGAYVFISEDYGQHWTSIKGNLPEEVVNVIIEDPEKEDLLFLGSDFATYFSLDGGKRWEHIYNIPNVASYDMIVHPRDGELVIGTHGRSVYVIDIKPMRKLAEKGKDTRLLTFEGEVIRYSDRWGKQQYHFIKKFQPQIELLYYVASKNQTIDIEIVSEKGVQLKKTITAKEKGFNYYRWDMKLHPLSKKNKMDVISWIYAEKGKYNVNLKVEDFVETVEVEVK